jgi:hypothetical protein
MPKRLSDDQYRQIITLWKQGHNKLQIARQLNISTHGVRNCLERFDSVEALDQYTAPAQRYPLLTRLQNQDYVVELHKSYAYLLAMYLGDGHITHEAKTYRLSITLDNRYPKLIDACIQAIQTVISDRAIRVVQKTGCKRLLVQSQELPLLFPQHGVGLKADRPIILTDWQQRIVDIYSLEFFRGLYHTDGSRFNNVVMGGYTYVRYQFTNSSADILNLFIATCDKLGLHWTRKTRKARHLNHHDSTDIFISRRADVEYLDSVIGAKS